MGQDPSKMELSAHDTDVLREDARTFFSEAKARTELKDIIDKLSGEHLKLAYDLLTTFYDRVK